MKQKLDKAELITHLKNQLDRLNDFSEIYDSGKWAIAQDMAVKLRVMFHNSTQSKSLIKQLKLEHLLFVDTGKKYESSYILAHWGLIRIELTSDPNQKVNFVPQLDDSDFKMADLENWWNSKKVIVDVNKNSFTRRSLILELANRDGVLMSMEDLILITTT